MKRAALLLVPLSLAWGGVAAAHYPMLITEDSEVEAKTPLEMIYTNGHPWMNDRYKPADPTKVGVYLPGRPFRSLMKYVAKHEPKPGAKETVPFWKLTYTPKKAGDYTFSWHCGVFLEPPNRQVADYAKMIVHVRDDDGAQVGWRRVLGDPLEIVPLTRPYAIPVGTAFRGRVVWNTPKGKSKTRFNTAPWMSAVVEAETYTPDKSHGTSYLPHSRLGVETDDNGVFVVTLPRAGWWLISCATDGGPGEQGSTTHVAKRAVLWVKVGGTVFDANAPKAPVKPHKHKHGSLLPDGEAETRHASRERTPVAPSSRRAAAVGVAVEGAHQRWLTIGLAVLLGGCLVRVTTRS